MSALGVECSSTVEIARLREAATSGVTVRLWGGRSTSSHNRLTKITRRVNTFD